MISDLEDKSRELIQNKTEREKKRQKIHRIDH